jgi:hypothetical protein
VRFIRSTDESAAKLAEKFGVTREHIWAVRRNRVWSHVV